MGRSAVKDLSPTSAVPLAYYTAAHAGLAAALLALVIEPALAGASFYQPPVVALVHLLTLAWLSGSILGSFYIVGPLALRIPMAVTGRDWIAFGGFSAGVAGMVAHFWMNRYDGMGWSAVFVFAAIAFVGWRASRGFFGSTAPWPVTLHVGLAFTNMLAAALLGMVMGFGRTRGLPGVSPLALMFAHAHVAAIGWAMMMVIGLSYRLIPMILPAAMPTGASLALSALLIEAGLGMLVVELLRESPGVWAAALLIVAGLTSFVMHIRRTVAHRLPRPPALPPRDWSTWQVHAAFVWLLASVALGVTLAMGVRDERRVATMWVYGVAGLVGFLAQIVIGMQGRLVPIYAWYRALESQGAPPAIAANSLPSASFARAIFLLWTAGVPLLAWGLPAQNETVIRVSALLLLAGIATGAAYIVHMLRTVRERA